MFASKACIEGGHPLYELHLYSGVRPASVYDAPYKKSKLLVKCTSFDDGTGPVPNPTFSGVANFSGIPSWVRVVSIAGAPILDFDIDQFLSERLFLVEGQPVSLSVSFKIFRSDIQLDIQKLLT